MPNLTGKSIGRYHILEQLGEGGMATVYKAYDTRLERNVAFKVLRTDQFIPAQLQMVLQRFEREAKSLAKLSHPNIVNILDYGEHEGNPYLVMEYLPGGTLKQKLGQAIPWQEAIRILLPVAHGLSYAHQHNIIHRDVKPANILMSETNRPILTDFGIAKLLEGADGHTLTASGVGIGTPEYMAPEQGIGAHTIDARADIYSLGIVLYEMITGRKPYTADTPMAVVLKQMTDPLPRPTDFIPELPEGVEHILFKALAKQPEDRYPDMDALIAAMEGALVEVHKAETPATVKELKKTAAPHAKLSRKVGMAVIGAFAVILVLVFGTTWLKQQFSNASITPEPAPSDAPSVETVTIETISVEPITMEILSEGLLAYYPFDGNANDASGNGNHGTVYNALLTQDRFGNPDRAYQFNGQSSYIDFPGVTSGIPNGTIILWFKGDSWNANTPNGIYIFSGAYGGNLGDGINLGTYSYYASDNSLLFGVFEFGSGAWHWAYSETIPQMGKWYCLTGTWGTSGIKFYIDSSLVGDEQYTGPAPYASYTRVGASNWPETNVMGSIDDVRIYNRALSSSEIQILCGLPSTTPTPPTISTIEIPPSSTSTSTPAPDWVVNFTEPILKAISDRPPTYEENFSNPDSGWYNGQTTGQAGHISGEFKYDNAEYVVIANGATTENPDVCSGGENQNVGIYADFVAEFDVRFVSDAVENGQGWAFNFHMNGIGFYAITLWQNEWRNGTINFQKCGLDGCSALVSVPNSGKSFNVDGNWNHILLIVHDTRMAAYVNGVPTLYLDDVSAPIEFRKGYFSVTSCNSATTILETRWDNFRIWDISNLP